MRKVGEVGTITKFYRYEINENVFLQTQIDIENGDIKGKSVIIYAYDDEDNSIEINFNEVENFKYAFADLNKWLVDEGIL